MKKKRLKKKLSAAKRQIKFLAERINDNFTALEASSYDAKNLKAVLSAIEAQGGRVKNGMDGRLFIELAEKAADEHLKKCNERQTDIILSLISSIESGGGKVEIGYNPIVKFPSTTNSESQARAFFQNAEKIKALEAELEAVKSNVEKRSDKAFVAEFYRRGEELRAIEKLLLHFVGSTALQKVESVLNKCVIENGKSSLNNNRIEELEKFRKQLSDFTGQIQLPDIIKAVGQLAEFQKDCFDGAMGINEKETQECKEPCGMNYCDDNGCSNRNRHNAPLSERPTPSIGEIEKLYTSKPVPTPYDAPKSINDRIRELEKEIKEAEASPSDNLTLSESLIRKVRIHDLKQLLFALLF